MVEFYEEIHASMRWLAREYSYFKDLKEDLKNLRVHWQTANKKTQVKKIRAALREAKFIGRAERRLDGHETLVEEGIRELNSQYIPTLTAGDEHEELLRRIHVEAAKLILYASYYQGKILSLLKHLMDEVESDEIEQAQAVLVEVEETISDTEQWIAALSLDLETAKKIAENVVSEQTAIISRAEFVQQLAEDTKVKGAVYGVNAAGLGIIKYLGYNGISLLHDFAKAWNALFIKSREHVKAFPAFNCRVLGSESKDGKLYAFRLIWPVNRRSARGCMAGFSLWFSLTADPNDREDYHRFNKIIPQQLKRIIHDPKILIDVFNIRSRSSEDRYFRQLYNSKLRIDPNTPGHAIFWKNIEQSTFWEWGKSKLTVVFK